MYLKESVLNRREKLIELFNSLDDSALSFKKLTGLFQVPKKDKEDFQRLLNSLVKSGFLSIDKNGCYQKKKASVLKGRFFRAKSGQAFMVYEKNQKEELIKISDENTKSAMDGDIVLVELLKSRKFDKRKIGKVVEIVERSVKTVVGTLIRDKNYAFVVPDGARQRFNVSLSARDAKELPNGYKVVVKITDYGNGEKNIKGKITEALGKATKQGMDVLCAAKSFGIEEAFPEEALAEAKKMPKRVLKRDMEGRLDLREVLMVTIDGADAKDLDDAISVSKEVSKEGEVFYQLGVHIADVSHYVTEGSALDKEALKRGTSVYLVDRVIPMLPKELSNGICSLNEKVNRLALSVLMKVNEKGEVFHHEIAETVIRIDYRLTYESVNRIITDEKIEDLEEKYAGLFPMLKTAHELSSIFWKNRERRGAINFELPETKILLDRKGRVKDIFPYDRNEATKLIEAFMLAANETVAEDAFWQELPFLYRSHEQPTEEKIKELNQFLSLFGYRINRKSSKKKGLDEIEPKLIQRLLKQIEGKPEEMMISRMTLRSMKRAKYVTESDGHFGLAARYYSHFTSPIRRYPDLQIHRILKENMRKGLSKERRKHYEGFLDEVALNSSALERRADEAERDVDKMKMAEYMADRVGEIFVGRISGLTQWNLYVELENTVEGFIPLRDMRDDDYSFDERRMELVGFYKRKRYRLGEKIKVRLIYVDKKFREIVFSIVE